MLTSQQIQQYHRDGFVTPDYRLPDTVLDDIRAAHDRLIARHPEYSDYCSALLAFDTWYLTVARVPEILDMVAQVIGENIALWNCSFFCKTCAGRHSDAVASGRRILADPSARHLHRVDRHRRRDTGERVFPGPPREPGVGRGTYQT